MSIDLYAEVTNQIVTMLEKGVVPWRSPILGRQSAGHPKNLESGKQYRGINVFLLAFTAWTQGYDSAYWMTFNQAKQRGGTVQEGREIFHSRILERLRNCRQGNRQDEESARPSLLQRI